MSQDRVRPCATTGGGTMGKFFLDVKNSPYCDLFML